MNLSTPLPADYRVRTLAAWLDSIDIGDHAGMARRIRALLEDVALKVAKVADNDGPDRPVTLDGIVASVLGGK